MICHHKAAAERKSSVAKKRIKDGQLKAHATSYFMAGGQLREAIDM
jgi:hypothetical protein